MGIALKFFILTSNSKYMSQPIRILIAEDDPDDFSFIAEACKQLLPPVSLIWAQNGKEVFSELAKCGEGSLPFLISLDFNMPFLNGLQALKKLKGNERYKNIPAVIYSSSVNERYKNEVLENGAAAYLVKGTSIEEIEQDVRNMLQTSPEISNSLDGPKD